MRAAVWCYGKLFAPRLGDSYQSFLGGVGGVCNLHQLLSCARQPTWRRGFAHENFSEHETMLERRSRRVLRKHAGEGRVIHLVRRMTSVGEGYRLRDTRRRRLRLSQQSSDKILASYVARSTQRQSVSHAACSQQRETGSGQNSCDVTAHGATASP